jgi:hypothetical protein
MWFDASKEGLREKAEISPFVRINFSLEGMKRVWKKIKVPY